MVPDLFSDATAPGFDNPLGMLSACHDRIQRQLATLDRLQRHLPEHGCDTDARAAARGILKYFDTAAPNHHADEEESLFPRLRRAAGRRDEALIAELEQEHRILAAHWRRLRPLLAGIAAATRANLSPRQVAEVRAAYAAHIAKEEQVLLPAIAATLDGPTLAEVSREMAARRGIDVPRTQTGRLPG